MPGPEDDKLDLDAIARAAGSKPKKREQVDPSILHGLVNTGDEPVVPAVEQPIEIASAPKVRSLRGGDELEGGLAWLGQQTPPQAPQAPRPKVEPPMAQAPTQPERRQPAFKAADVVNIVRKLATVTDKQIQLYEAKSPKGGFSVRPSSLPTVPELEKIVQTALGPAINPTIAGDSARMEVLTAARKYIAVSAAVARLDGNAQIIPEEKIASLRKTYELFLTSESDNDRAQSAKEALNKDMTAIKEVVGQSIVAVFAENSRQNNADRQRKEWLNDAASARIIEGMSAAGHAAREAERKEKSGERGGPGS